MPITSAKKDRDDAKVDALLQKKFDLSAQMAAIKAQMADINRDMMKAGANTDEIACL